METIFLRTSAQDICLFKSYYVVWKPFSYILSPRALYSFKSYYVVWKRHMMKNKPLQAIGGLNRTM